jgi:CheY-like chemotaxis protein
MKVLLVDGDAGMLALMARLLTDRGHAVELCHGPFGASAQVLRHAPDVVLLDATMPGLDGVALAGLIARLPLAPPPLVVLWSTDEDALERAAAETALLTLSKRSPSAVVATLERLHAPHALEITRSI